MPPTSSLRHPPPPAVFSRSSRRPPPALTTANHCCRPTAPILALLCLPPALLLVVARPLAAPIVIVRAREGRGGTSPARSLFRRSDRQKSRRHSTTMACRLRPHLRGGAAASGWWLGPIWGPRGGGRARAWWAMATAGDRTTMRQMPHPSGFGGGGSLLPSPVNCRGPVDSDGLNGGDTK